MQHLREAFLLNRSGGAQGKWTNLSIQILGNIGVPNVIQTISPRFNFYLLKLQEYRLNIHKSLMRSLSSHLQVIASNFGFAYQLLGCTINFYHLLVLISLSIPLCCAIKLLIERLVWVWPSPCEIVGCGRKKLVSVILSFSPQAVRHQNLKLRLRNKPDTSQTTKARCAQSI